MENKKKVIIISGSTASGKTSTSIELAKELVKEKSQSPIIINFDSLLFYKELNIGTAKPTLKEQGGIEHEMIGIVSAKKELNAADYIKKTLPLINQYLENKREVILVGGSAFYIRALIKGMYDSPTTPLEIKKEVEDLFKTQGIDGIRNILEIKDPPSYKQLHENDHYRNIRALEHFLTTGSPFSKQKEAFDKNEPYNFSKIIHNWDIEHIYLEIEKEKHWKIMEERASLMVKSGLIKEVQSILNLGFDGSEKPLKSIGYKETISFIHGDISTHSDLIERIYLSTRKLAKAQKTFFNKISNKQSFNPLKDSITNILNK